MKKQIHEFLIPFFIILFSFMPSAALRAQMLVPVVTGGIIFVAPTRICHGLVNSTNGNVNTSPLNCVGATVFVVEITDLFATAGTCGPPIDSSTNTWQTGPNQVSGSNLLYVNTYYVFNPTVTSSQTFKSQTCTGGDPALHITGYSGGPWVGSVDGAGVGGLTNAGTALGFGIIALGTGSGTYVSGGSVTGINTQTCHATLFSGPTPNGAVGDVTLNGANTLGPTINITTAGFGFLIAPTTATLSSGTATCSGTATVSTTLTYYAPAASTEVCTAILGLYLGTSPAISGAGWSTGDSTSSVGITSLSAYMLSPTGGTGLSPTWSWTTSSQSADLALCFK